VDKGEKTMISTIKRDLMINKLLLIDSFEVLVEFCNNNNMSCCGPIFDKLGFEYCSDLVIEDDGEDEYEQMLKLFDNFKYCSFTKANVFAGLTHEDFFAYKGVALVEAMGILNNPDILSKFKTLLPEYSL